MIRYSSGFSPYSAASSAIDLAALRTAVSPSVRGVEVMAGPVSGFSPRCQSRLSIGERWPAPTAFLCEGDFAMPETPEPLNPTEPGGEMEHNDPRRADDLEKAQ